MENLNDNEREGWDNDGNRLVEVLTGTQTSGNINDLDRESSSTITGAIQINIL